MGFLLNGTLLITSKWRMVPVPYFTKMTSSWTSVLLLKTINVLTKFLILSDNLLFNKFVSPKGYF